MGRDGVGVGIFRLGGFLGFVFVVVIIFVFADKPVFILVTVMPVDGPPFFFRRVHGLVAVGQECRDGRGYGSFFLHEFAFEASVFPALVIIAKIF